VGDLSYAASLPSRKMPLGRHKKREGFRPPLSRVAGLLPRLDGSVTSPRLPEALKFLRTAASDASLPTWIDADHRGPLVLCQRGSRFNANF